MMKKMDKKKIILSVLLSSMLWSNSLYACELNGDGNGQVVSSVDKLEELFEVITIPGTQLDGILQLKNNEKLTINGVKLEANEELTINGVKLKDAVFNNVSEVKNSTLNTVTVYGGLNDSGNDNKISITNSMLSTVAGGLGIANDTNANHVIIVNSNVGQAFGGTSLNGNSNNNVVEVIYDKNTYNTTDDTIKQVFGGSATDYGERLGESSSRDKITANQNTVIINGNNKNLSSKIGITVAQILSMRGTATKLEANNNSAYIKNFGNENNKASTGNVIGGNITSSSTYSAKSVTWDSSKNLVNIENSYLEIDNNKFGVVGAAIVSDWENKFEGTATANENIVNIKDSLIDITNADMGITGGFVSEVSDGKFTGLTSADNNIVNIDNSSVVGQYIVGGRNDRGQANNNVVSIKENNFVGVKIIGGWSEFASANNNIIEINGYNNLISSSLYGYYAEEKSENSEFKNSEFKNNTLIVNDFNGGIMEVANFNKVTFNNLKWNTAAVSENNEVDISGTKIPEFKTDGGMYVAKIDNVDAIEIGKLGNNNLKKDDKAWLIFTPKNNNDEISKFNGQEFKNYSGVAKIVSGNLLYKDDVKFTGSDNSGTTQTLPVEALSAVVKGVERNAQTDLVASNRAVAAAFVNQGTDLIADSLDTLSRDGKYGVKTFAAVHGNRSKYDVNSDIKINGWSTIVGVGAENEHNGGDFSWGVFYENGSGNYRTYNDFNNEFFRGDGSLVYNGGGIAARYENSHGVYTEGSLRAGMLKSEMTDALSDGENKYGYESETAYYGAHIGVGKIFSLGDDSDLDVYGKFFHTYTEGDSFNVAGDEFEFDSINSDRLRIGARVTSNKENKFSTYYGLAYEYEFNGDAEMRAAGMKAPTQSLQGSSVMAEIGLNYQPTPDSPWSFDLNMRGYAGERQGGSFNVQATYTF